MWYQGGSFHCIGMVIGMNKTVLCFGSRSLKGDDIAFIVCEELKGKIRGVRFIHCDLPLDVIDFAKSDKLYILDAVEGAENVTIYRGIEDFRKMKSVTVHDNDLSLILKILKEMKILPKVRIIGIPIGSTPSKAVSEVKRLLTSKS